VSETRRVEFEISTKNEPNFYHLAALAHVRGLLEAKGGAHGHAVLRLRELEVLVESYIDQCGRGLL
jgi:hypothetical protein